jgi:LytS/YehU family sensor histidine kinase
VIPVYIGAHNTILLVTAIYEGIRTFERWERTLRETEQLKKANLQSQSEGLKNQINPHFLFNSLNTLSSLIEEDPNQAEEFVEEMASVYRYLLCNPKKRG